MSERPKNNSQRGTSHRSTEGRETDDEQATRKLDEEILRLGAWAFSLEYKVPYDIVSEYAKNLQPKPEVRSYQDEFRDKANASPVAKPFTQEDRARAELAARADKVRQEFLEKQRTNPLYGLLMVPTPWENDEAVDRQDKFAEFIGTGAQIRTGVDARSIGRNKGTESRSRPKTKDITKEKAPPKKNPTRETKLKSPPITDEERQITNRNRGLEPTAESVRRGEIGEGNRLANPHLAQEEAMLAQIAKEDSLRNVQKPKPPRKKKVPAPKKNLKTIPKNLKTIPVEAPQAKPPEIQPPGPTIARFGQEEADMLISFWSKKLKATKDPKLREEYQKKINVLSRKGKPDWKQSEEEITFFHTLYGGKRETTYRDGRELKKSESRKGSTKPDFVAPNVMGEVKNFNVVYPSSEEAANRLIDNLANQINARRAHGDPDIKAQTVVLDLRGQKLSENQMQQIGRTLAERTGLPVEHIQIVIWD